MFKWRWLLSVIFLRWSSHFFAVVFLLKPQSIDSISDSDGKCQEARPHTGKTTVSAVALKSTCLLINYSCPWGHQTCRTKYLAVSTCSVLSPPMTNGGGYRLSFKLTTIFFFYLCLIDANVFLMLISKLLYLHPLHRFTVVGNQSNSSSICKLHNMSSWKACSANLFE